MSDIKNLKIGLENMLSLSEKVMIFPHKGADFDAIASSLGVSLIADRFKKENHILVGDPIYKLDHGVQTIVDEVRDDHSIMWLDQYKSESHDDDLNILCDVNKPQLTYVQELPKDKLVIIDHHDKDEQTFDAKIEHIDTTSSSASEIITSLLNCFKVDIPEDIANILLSGILLDTNRLSKSVTSDTMRNVTKLLESGATIEKANSYFSEDFKSDRKIQELISSTKFINYTIALIQGEEDKEYTKEELAKAADYLLKYKVDAAYAIGNIGDDTISVSARSKDSVNVGNVMRELEGGGNQYSAATKLKNTSIQEVGERLIKIIFPNHFNGKNI